ncbi:hypothetical protein, partial [Pseudomonas aeruginosa]|uniref:hypothetical protein n=1 Tax=Pseudomonas aeruginosa TaxID=287 RepID=UPI001ED9AAF0
ACLYRGPRNGCGGCARMLRLPPGVKEGIPQPACTEAPEIFVICSNAGAVPTLMSALAARALS